MTVQPAVAPSLPTYATYTPYLTVAEYLFHPTGVDVSQLLPDETYETNLAALVTVIAEASSEADGIVEKALAATLDIEAGNYMVGSGWKIRVPVKYSPVIMVTNVAIGPDPAHLTNLTDLSRVQVGPKVITIPVPGAGYRGSGYGYGSRPYVEVTYVNGYATTTTGDASAAADQQLLAVNPLGLAPGLPFTVYDGPSTEASVVGAGYTIGSSTVPLAAPLVYAHSAGTSMSSLPPRVKDAVVKLTTWRIKTQGAQGLVMASVTAQPDGTEKTVPGDSGEFAQAKAILLKFKRSR
jgi:hypothetical protein